MNADQIQSIAIQVAFVVGALVFVKYLPRLTAGVPFVEPQAVKKLMDEGKDVVVVDVRTAGEFTGSLGHIPGAINLTPGDLKERIGLVAEKLEAYKNEPVFVLCRTENRAPGGARVLKQAGFTNVAVVKGGMARWNREGFPVEGVGA
ncbi:MAG: rhodanese-like domain-containing protein [Magnetospirillum sp. WYHS-4]